MLEKHGGQKQALSGWTGEGSQQKWVKVAEPQRMMKTFIWSLRVWMAQCDWRENPWRTQNKNEALSAQLFFCLCCVPSYLVHLNHWLLYWKHISTCYILNISPKFLVWHFHTLKPWNLNLVKHHLNYTPDSHIIVARLYVSWPSLIRHPSRTRNVIKSTS